MVWTEIGSGYVFSGILSERSLHVTTEGGSLKYYIGDATSGKVYRLSESSGSLTIDTPTSDNTWDINNPSGLFVDNTHFIIGSGNRVRVYNRSDGSEDSAYEFQVTSGQNIQGVAEWGGYIYALTNEGWIFIRRREGFFTQHHEHDNTNLGISGDESGLAITNRRIYVAYYGLDSSNIRVFDHDLNRIEGEDFTVPYSVDGLSYHDHILYVLDTSGNRVRRYENKVPIEPKPTFNFKYHIRERIRSGREVTDTALNPVPSQTHTIPSADIPTTSAMAVRGNTAYIMDKDNDRIRPFNLDTNAFHSSGVISNITHDVNGMAITSDRIFYNNGPTSIRVINNDGTNPVGRNNITEISGQKIQGLHTHNDLLYVLSERDEAGNDRTPYKINAFDIGPLEHNEEITLDLIEGQVYGLAISDARIFVSYWDGSSALRKIIAFDHDGNRIEDDDITNFTSEIQGMAYANDTLYTLGAERHLNRYVHVTHHEFDRPRTQDFEYDSEISLDSVYWNTSSFGVNAFARQGDRYYIGYIDGTDGTNHVGVYNVSDGSHVRTIDMLTIIRGIAASDDKIWVSRDTSNPNESLIEEMDHDGSNKSEIDILGPSHECVGLQYRDGKLYLLEGVISGTLGNNITIYDIETETAAAEDEIGLPPLEGSDGYTGLGVSEDRIYVLPFQDTSIPVESLYKQVAVFDLNGTRHEDEDIELPDTWNARRGLSYYDNSIYVVNEFNPQAIRKYDRTENGYTLPSYGFKYAIRNILFREVILDFKYEIVGRIKEAILSAKYAIRNKVKGTLHSVLNYSTTTLGITPALNISDDNPQSWTYDTKHSGGPHLLVGYNNKITRFRIDSIGDGQPDTSIDGTSTEVVLTNGRPIGLAATNDYIYYGLTSGRIFRINRNGNIISSFITRHTTFDVRGLSIYDGKLYVYYRPRSGNSSDPFIARVHLGTGAEEDTWTVPGTEGSTSSLVVDGDHAYIGTRRNVDGSGDAHVHVYRFNGSTMIRDEDSEVFEPLGGASSTLSGLTLSVNNDGTKRLWVLSTNNRFRWFNFHLTGSPIYDFAYSIRKKIESVHNFSYQIARIIRIIANHFLSYSIRNKVYSYGWLNVDLDNYETVHDLPTGRAYRGITINDGILYILQDRDEILRYDVRNNQILSAVDITGSGPHTTADAQGIAITPDNRLYVKVTNEHFISMVIDRDGNTSDGVEFDVDDEDQSRGVGLDYYNGGIYYLHERGSENAQEVIRYEPGSDHRFSTGTLVIRFTDDDDTRESFIIDNDGAYIYTGNNGNIKIYSADDNILQTITATNVNSIRGLTKEGNAMYYLARTSPDNTYHIRKVQRTGQVFNTKYGIRDKINRIALDAKYTIRNLVKDAADNTEHILLDFKYAIRNLVKDIADNTEHTLLDFKYAIRNRISGIILDFKYQIEETLQVFTVTPPSGETMVPRGITYLNDHFYIVDQAEHVHKYNSDFEEVGSHWTFETVATQAEGITSDGTNLYIVTRQNSVGDDGIFCFNEDGTREAGNDITLHSSNQNPRGITYYDGRFYVVDASSDNVHVYDTDGTHLDSQVDLHDDHGNPQGIAIADGVIWSPDIVDDRMYAANVNGTALSPDPSFDLHASDDSPRGITYSSPYLYVLDDSGASITVRQYRISLPFIRAVYDFAYTIREKISNTLDSKYAIRVKVGKIPASEPREFDDLGSTFSISDISRFDLVVRSMDVGDDGSFYYGVFNTAEDEEQIRIYNRNGTNLFNIENLPITPNGIAFDSDNNRIYYGGFAGEIYSNSQGSSPQSHSGIVPVSDNIFGMAYYNGEVWILHGVFLEAQRVITRWNPTDNTTVQAGTVNASSPSLYQGIAVDSDRVYIATTSTFATVTTILAYDHNMNAIESENIPVNTINSVRGLTFHDNSLYIINLDGTNTLEFKRTFYDDPTPHNLSYAIRNKIAGAILDFKYEIIGRIRPIFDFAYGIRNVIRTDRIDPSLSREIREFNNDEIESGLAAWMEIHNDIAYMINIAGNGNFGDVINRYNLDTDTFLDDIAITNRSYAGIAVTGDYIFLSTGGGTLYRRDADGTNETTYNMAEDIYDITWHDNRLWALTGEDNTVIRKYVLNDDGRPNYDGSAINVIDGNVAYITVDDNHIYLINSENGRIYIFDHTGSLEYTTTGNLGEGTDGSGNAFVFGAHAIDGSIYYLVHNDGDMILKRTLNALPDALQSKYAIRHKITTQADRFRLLNRETITFVNPHPNLNSLDVTNGELHLGYNDGGHAYSLDGGIRHRIWGSGGLNENIQGSFQRGSHIYYIYDNLDIRRISWESLSTFTEIGTLNSSFGQINAVSGITHSEDKIIVRRPHGLEIYDYDFENPPTPEIAIPRSAVIRYDFETTDSGGVTIVDDDNIIFTDGSKVIHRNTSENVQSTFDVGFDVVGISYSPSDDRVYLTNGTSVYAYDYVYGPDNPIMKYAIRNKIVGSTRRSWRDFDLETTHTVSSTNLGISDPQILSIGVTGDRIYVAARETSTFGGKLFVYSKSDQFHRLTVEEPPGTNSLGFSPFGMAVDEDNRIIYMARNASDIRRWQWAGDNEPIVRLTDNFEVDDPISGTISSMEYSNGRLWVLYGGPDTVRAYNMDGSTHSTITNFTDDAIAVTEDRIYGLSGDTINIYELDGTLLETETNSVIDGAINGIAIHGRDLYIAHDNTRIRRYEAQESEVSGYGGILPAKYAIRNRITSTAHNFSYVIRGLVKRVILDSKYAIREWVRIAGHSGRIRHTNRGETFGLGDANSNSQVQSMDIDNGRFYYGYSGEGSHAIRVYDGRRGSQITDNTGTFTVDGNVRGIAVNGNNNTVYYYLDGNTTGLYSKTVGSDAIEITGVLPAGHKASGLSWHDGKLYMVHGDNSLSGRQFTSWNPTDNTTETIALPIHNNSGYTGIAVNAHRIYALPIGDGDENRIIKVFDLSGNAIDSETIRLPDTFTARRGLTVHGGSLFVMNEINPLRGNQYILDYGLPTYNFSYNIASLAVTIFMHFYTKYAIRNKITKPEALDFKYAIRNLVKDAMNRTAHDLLGFRYIIRKKIGGIVLDSKYAIRNRVKSIINMVPTPVIFPLSFSYAIRKLIKSRLDTKYQIEGDVPDLIPVDIVYLDASVGEEEVRIL